VRTRSKRRSFGPGGFWAHVIVLGVADNWLACGTSAISPYLAHKLDSGGDTSTTAGSGGTSSTAGNRSTTAGSGGNTSTCICDFVDAGGRGVTSGNMSTTAGSGVKSGSGGVQGQAGQATTQAAQVPRRALELEDVA